MDTMELQFPEDAREADVRAGRNISETERWVSMAAGAGMALYGLSRRRTSGLVLAGLGAWLFKRGMSGHCDTYQMLGVKIGRASCRERV